MKSSGPADKTPVFIHVDLDGLWTLAGVYGFEEKNSFEEDPVFNLALQRMTEMFTRRGVKAGIFIVGRDLELGSKRAAVAETIAAGHEPCNHSYHHCVGLERRPAVEIGDEIGRTQEAINAACGITPVGFRAPGYDAGVNVLKACISLGLKYEGSQLPTPWGRLLRYAASRLRKRVARECGREADFAAFAGQYGQGGGGRIPAWFPGESEAQRILRLPLAVSRGLRLPLHASLGMLLGENWMINGWRRILRQGLPATFLLHGLDFLNPQEFARGLPNALSRSRAFQIPLAAKQSAIERTFDVIQTDGMPMLASTYVEALGLPNHPQIGAD